MYYRFLLPLLSWPLLLSRSLAFVLTESQLHSNHPSWSSLKSSSSDNNVNAAAFEPLSGNRQKAWQHAKKPLLRIGGKGATKTHGNSLRQLLDQHTVVKVKVNPSAFEEGSLLNAFEVLKQLAVESGANEGMELIHIRTSDKVILFGKEGTLGLIDSGDFPPPPPPPREPREEE
jgi:RNA-binding protein YhbY